MKLARALLGFCLLIIGISSLLSLEARAQTVTQGAVSNPHTASGNSWGGSMLDPIGKSTSGGDRVLIAQSRSTTELSPICRTVMSTRNDSLFVPWGSIPEWNDFLASANYVGLTAPAACPPSAAQTAFSAACPSCSNCANNLNVQIIDDCCPPLAPVLCNSGTPTPLGYRTLGVPLTNKLGTISSGAIPAYASVTAYNSAVLTPTMSTTANWGAAGNGTTTAVYDTWGPLYATVNSAGNPVDYQVTYVCKNGVWNKTRELGSCVPLDGACGLVPGSGLSGLPTDLSMLCAQGSILHGGIVTPTPPTGTPTRWDWQCDGTPGRQNALCYANYSATASVGNCGPVNGTTIATLTSGSLGLCASGFIANFVALGTGGTGPWTWQCLGTGTGTSNANCSASYGTSSAVPQCQTYPNGITKSQALAFTATQMCISGVPNAIPPSVGGGAIPWYGWECCSDTTCASTVWCSTTNLDVDGMCGTANGTVYADAAHGPDYYSSPTFAGTINNMLCNDSSIPPISFNAATGVWTWTCLGQNAGVPAFCSASVGTGSGIVPGMCGPLDSTGVTVSTPITLATPGLCLYGTPFNLAYNSGTYSWFCQGANGGQTAQYCSTLLVGGAQCGNTSGPYDNITPPLATDLCLVGTATAPSVDLGYWHWTCSDSVSGSATNCSALISVTLTGGGGACGSATTSPSTTAPSVGLCAGSTDTASAVVKDSTGSYWTWTCTNSGGTATCLVSDSAPQAPSGTCGSASTAGPSPVAPSISNLCLSGSPTAVGPDTGFANWVWSCIGTTTTTTCSEPMSPALGECGTSSGQSIPNQPNTNLCLSGIASTVSGTLTVGPWSWMCYGLGGASNSPLCNSTQCAVCSGSNSFSQSSIITKTIGSCTITATLAWTETDSLLASGSSASYGVTLTDPLFGTTALTAVPSAVGYCPPCYATSTGVSAPSLSVSSVTGTGCTVAAGQTLPVTSLTSP